MLSQDWLSAFVPIGLLRHGDTWIPKGAGVLVHNPPFVWLITASHVIPTSTTDHIGLFVTDREQGRRVCLDLTKEQQAYKVDWVRDPANDVAACLMPLNPVWEIKAVGQELCTPFQELLPSMQCYTVGCPYGLAGVDPQRATPLVLDGIVCGINSGDRLIYISTPTFPGNSGGPIIVVRPPYNPGGSIVVGTPTVFLAGIVREQVIIRGDEKDAPMLHLGRGSPISIALELIQSTKAQEQLARMSRPT